MAQLPCQFAGARRIRHLEYCVPESRKSLSPKAESITMQTLFSQPPARVATIAKVDFRRVLNRVKFAPRAIKCGVVLLFSVLWLVVALVRSTAPRDAESLETSSLMALARLLQENFISGRDFQSVFGPGMQFLVAIATSLTNAPP